MPTEGEDMSHKTRLSDAEIEAALADEGLSGWSRDGNRLHRKFVFGDFVEAFAFMTAAALVAERMDHHPDWSNVYKTVTVNLSTHEAGGLTQLDLDLAKAMGRIAGG
jgi:4a-hydroxytetrahydrobiopterin dehydratase